MVEESFFALIDFDFFLIFQASLGKDTEIVETREKAKTEFDKKLRLIQRDIDMNEELKTRIQKLEHDLKGNRKIFFCFVL